MKCNQHKQDYLLLFIPWIRTPNLLMRQLSLSFLEVEEFTLHLSNITAFMFESERPGRLKWAPVSWVRSQVLTQPMCSLNLFSNCLPDSPMYCIPLQAALSHEIQSITFEVVQLYSLPRLIEKLVPALLTLFVVVMKGQALQLALLARINNQASMIIFKLEQAKKLLSQSIDK